MGALGALPALRRKLGDGTGKTGLVKPAFERALVRNRQRGPFLLQHDADQTGPPGGMAPPQQEGGAVNQAGTAGTAQAAVLVTREQPGLPVVSIPPPDFADGGEGKGKRLGDGAEGLSFFMALGNALPQRYGDRAWHGLPPFRQARWRCRPRFTHPVGPGTHACVALPRAQPSVA
jgi:hypothetical protein